MARKTFISYKYSEATGVRDRIIEALGEDAQFYKGETADSPDMTDNKADSIKESLKTMIFDTSTTIVVISPNMIQSKWIDWEIEYSLKEITRGDRTSRANGIVGVIAKQNGSYDWMVTYTNRTDDCSPSRSFKEDLLYKLITANRFNKKNPVHSCETCKTYDSLKDSYISLIDEDVFLNDPTKYIENAYQKSETIHDFNITKERIY